MRELFFTVQLPYSEEGEEASFDGWVSEVRERIAKGAEVNPDEVVVTTRADL